jgi:hypothetical protein
LRAGEAPAARQPTRSDELRLDTLQVGGQTYTNVRILPQTGRTIVITHAGGMTTINADDLSPEAAAKLAGHVPQAQATSRRETPEAGAGPEGRANGFWARLRQRVVARDDADPGPRNPPVRPVASFPAVLCLLAIHLAYSYCLRRICLKTESRAGWAVWVPVLQVIRAHQAAGISPALMLLWPCCGVAPLYLVGKLFGACGRNPWLGVLLALPSWGGFLFLASALPKALGQHALASPEQIAKLTSAILLGGGDIALGIGFLFFPCYALIAYPFLAFTK